MAKKSSKPSDSLKFVNTEIEGLEEVRKALSKMDKTFAHPQAVPELKKAGHDVAEMVAREARRRAPIKKGKLRDSIKAGNVAKGAIVRGGGAKVPYFIVQEFGGSVLKKKGGRLMAQEGAARNIGYMDRAKLSDRIIVKPRSPRLGRGNAGYFLFPAVRDLYDEAVETYLKQVEKIFHKYFPEGR